MSDCLRPCSSAAPPPPPPPPPPPLGELQGGADADEAVKRLAAKYKAGGGGGGASDGAAGVRPLPQDASSLAGARTGVYDCRGQAILVGSLLGRMLPGQPCEDRLLLVTAGEWKVGAFGPAPGDAGEGAVDSSIQTALDGSSRVRLTLRGVTGGVNRGTILQLSPLKGAFTSWKVVTGATADLFLPANVAAVAGRGVANQAGSKEGPSHVTNLLSRAQGLQSSVWTASAASLQASSPGGGGATDDAEVSAMGVERVKANDWDQTDREEEKRLTLCPGPNCPTTLPASHGIMHFGSPVWKYLVCAGLLCVVVACEMLRRRRRRAGGMGGVDYREEYVHLPGISPGISSVVLSPAPDEGSELLPRAVKRGAMPCVGASRPRAATAGGAGEEGGEHIVIVNVGAAAPAGGGYQSGGT